MIWKLLRRSSGRLLFSLSTINSVPPRSLVIFVLVRVDHDDIIEALVKSGQFEIISHILNDLGRNAFPRPRSQAGILSRLRTLNDDSNLFVILRNQIENFLPALNTKIGPINQNFGHTLIQGALQGSEELLGGSVDNI